MDLSQVVALLTAGDYTISREIIHRGFGVLFLIAFASAFNQFPALLGERGLTPAPRFIALTSARQAPTIFRWKRFAYSDRRLRLVCVILHLPPLPTAQHRTAPPQPRRLLSLVAHAACQPLPQQ